MHLVMSPETQNLYVSDVDVYSANEPENEDDIYLGRTIGEQELLSRMGEVVRQVIVIPISRSALESSGAGRDVVAYFTPEPLCDMILRAIFDIQDSLQEDVEATFGEPMPPAGFVLLMGEPISEKGFKEAWDAAPGESTNANILSSIPGALYVLGWLDTALYRAG